MDPSINALAQVLAELRVLCAIERDVLYNLEQIRDALRLSVAATPTSSEFCGWPVCIGGGEVSGKVE